MEHVQKRVAIVWLALLALLALTVAASFVVTAAASAVVSFGVAAAKAVLIFWFFMRLRTEKGLDAGICGGCDRLARNSARHGVPRPSDPMTA